MSNQGAQQPQREDLKLMQGRWYEGPADGNGDAPGSGTRLALREDEAQSARRGAPQPAVQQHGYAQPRPDQADPRFDPFVAVVSGQVALTRQQPAAHPGTGTSRRDQAIALMYKYIQCENARDYDTMVTLFPAAGFHSKTYFGNDPISPHAHVRMLKGLFRSFPDWFMVINEIVSADDESCVALITGRGTQYEEFAGRPPRDHQIAIPTLHAIKVRDGLIVEHRHINPFEDIFANQIMAPLTEDIMAVRAQQGFDSSMAQRAYDLAVAAGADEDKLGQLRALVETKRRQCQVLLKGTLRRCAMIAPPGELYCEHHQEHGYGIDGLE